MANIKHEDAILKMGFEYFRDTILKTLGINYEFVETGITELVELTIHSLYMDFTFLTTGDFYIHIEFQTTDSGKKDLRRFRAYESVLSHKAGKNVITYVIYSGGIEHTITEMDCGAYVYRVLPIYLADKFLEGKDLEKVKEVVAMTRIGQMIFDDGVVRGREKGREEGMIGGTIKTCKKFKLSREDAIKNIIEEFSLSNEEAEKYMELYW